MSQLSTYLNDREDLNHRNHMPKAVRDKGIILARAFQPYMNNVEAAAILDVDEATIRRWLKA